MFTPNRLDNQEEIKRAKNTIVQEVEPMYWILEDFLYDNKIEKATSMYESFLYLAQYNKPTLMTLQKPYLKRLKEISYQLIDTTYVPITQKVIEIKNGTMSSNITYEKESQLEDYLFSNITVLEDALKDKISLLNRQVPIGDGYFCDLTAKNDINFYAIEIKIKKANHAVVSQCNKYCYYFYRRLRYDKFRNIQGVVIANAFDEWSINELRRNNVWIFSINQTTDKTTLEQIK